MTESVYVLLPVHNRREVTRKFILCLKEQTCRQYHLVVIDDGSTDGTAAMVVEELPMATVLKGNGHLWWAGALQKGFEWLAAQPVAAKDVILIINDDTEFDADFIAKGVALLNKSPATLLLPWCYDGKDGRLVDCGVTVDWDRLEFRRAGTPEEVNCLSTRGLFLRFGDFVAIGGLRHRLLPHYLSDYEFTMRALRKGKRLVATAELVLRVDIASTGISSSKQMRLGSFLRQSLSIRCKENPIFFTSFVLLSCPPAKRLGAVKKVWHRYWRALRGAAVGR